MSDPVFIFDVHLDLSMNALLFNRDQRWTQERIATYYRRPSKIIYPPIDTTFFTPGSKQKQRD